MQTSSKVSDGGVTRHDFEAMFGGARVMVILRGLPPGETVRLAERAWDLGIDVVEVPVLPRKRCRRCAPP